MEIAIRISWRLVCLEIAIRIFLEVTVLGNCYYNLFEVIVAWKFLLEFLGG